MADRMADLEARVAALEMIFSGKPEGVVGPPIPEQVHDVVERDGGVHAQSPGDKDVVVLDGRHDKKLVAQEAERDLAAREAAEKATHDADEKPTAAWLEPEAPHRRQRAAPKDDEPKPAAPQRPADDADLYSGGVARNPAVDAHQPDGPHGEHVHEDKK